MKKFKYYVLDFFVLLGGGIGMGIGVSLGFVVVNEAMAWFWMAVM